MNAEYWTQLNCKESNDFLFPIQDTITDNNYSMIFIPKST